MLFTTLSAVRKPVVLGVTSLSWKQGRLGYRGLRSLGKGVGCGIRDAFCVNKQAKTLGQKGLEPTGGQNVKSKGWARGTGRV